MKEDLGSNLFSAIYLLCNLHSHIHPLPILFSLAYFYPGLFRTCGFPCQEPTSLRYPQGSLLLIQVCSFFPHETTSGHPE